MLIKKNRTHAINSLMDMDLMGKLHMGKVFNRKNMKDLKVINHNKSLILQLELILVQFIEIVINGLRNDFKKYFDQ